MNDASGALPSPHAAAAADAELLRAGGPGAADRLLAELPGILLWAVEGWRRLRARGKFRQPASGESVLCSLNELSSPVTAFVEERCELGREYEVEKWDLYANWTVWCEEHGQRAGSREMFGKNLLAAYPELDTGRPGSRGDRQWCYTGIRLKEMPGGVAAAGTMNAMQVARFRADSRRRRFRCVQACPGNVQAGA